MQVEIKNFDVKMLIQNNGIELQVNDTPANGNRHLGDLVITRTRLVWCKGQTSVQNGKSINWANFITYMESL